MTYKNLMLKAPKSFTGKTIVLDGFHIDYNVDYGEITNLLTFKELSTIELPMKNISESNKEIEMVCNKNG